MCCSDQRPGLPIEIEIKNGNHWQPLIEHSPVVSSCITDEDTDIGCNIDCTWRSRIEHSRIDRNIRKVIAHIPPVLSAIIGSEDMAGIEARESNIGNLRVRRIDRKSRDETVRKPCINELPAGAAIFRNGNVAV